MKTPFDSFQALLTGLINKYHVSGLVDISVGTGLNHIGLTLVMGELWQITETTGAEVDRNELLGLYEVLLRQLLHNIGADDDGLVNAHLGNILAVMSPTYVPELVQERKIDGDRFKKDEVLAIMHAAIA